MFNWLISKLYQTKIPQISPTDLDGRKSEFYIVDVRTSLEWKKSHILGAQNHPVHTLNTRTLKNIQHAAQEANKEIVVICLSAHRSTPIAARLNKQGSQAYELSGGMMHWWLKKLPCE